MKAEKSILAGVPERTAGSWQKSAAYHEKIASPYGCMARRKIPQTVMWSVLPDHIPTIHPSQIPSSVDHGRRRCLSLHDTL